MSFQSRFSKMSHKKHNISRISLIDLEFQKRFSVVSPTSSPGDESKTSDFDDFSFRNKKNLSVFDRKLIFANNRKCLLKSIVQNGREDPTIPNVQYIPGCYSYKTNLKFNLQKQFNKFLENPTLYKDDNEIIALAAKKVLPRKCKKSYQNASNNTTVPNTLRKLGLQQKMHLKIMEAKLHEPESSFEIKNAILHLQKYLKETVSCNSKYRKSIDDVKHMYFNLIDYRPSHSPYVPLIIRELANSIEAIAYETNGWNKVYLIDESSIAKSVLLLKKILKTKQSDEKRKQLLSKLSLGELSNLMLLFFRFLKKKPFILQKEHLVELVKHPLYDNYFRPNPVVKSLLSDSMLRCSRTNVDTLSFVMIHINHVWEYSITPTQCRKRLANIFGPLIVSLEEKPIIIPKQNKPVECAILESVMDQCDQTFWNNVGSHLTNSLFDRHNPLDFRSKEQSAVFRYVNNHARNYLRPIEYILKDESKPQCDDLKDYLHRAKRQLWYDESSIGLYDDLDND